MEVAYSWCRCCLQWERQHTGRQYNMFCDHSQVYIGFCQIREGNRQAQVSLAWEFQSLRCKIESLFIKLALLTFWPDNSLVVQEAGGGCWAVLCIVGCLAVSLASAQQMPVTSPQLWQPKMSPEMPDISWKQNYFHSRSTALTPLSWFLQNPFKIHLQHWYYFNIDLTHLSLQDQFYNNFPSICYMAEDFPMYYHQQ